MLDGNSRQNLATFCQTWLEPEIHDLMDLTIDKNMIDKDEYPQTAELEARCVHMLADLWNSPDAANTLGTSTTGSSEAAMLGGMALLWNWRAQQKAAGKPIDKPNMVTGPVQVCWHKFTRYWDVEHREFPMEGDRLIMNAEEVLKRVDENTIGVVPTLGVTFTCDFEPVKEVSEALDKLQEETGLNIPIHVDGASGGFLAPFVYPDLEWDFRLPRVKSINTSGHKFGLAPLGVVWVIWRDEEDLPPETLESLGSVSKSRKRRYLGWKPGRIDFWASFPQFLGTLAFNITTATAFLSVQWLGYDILVWSPDFVGSVLFLISGVAGVFEFCHHFWCWQRKSLTWWIVIINFVGCVAFMISAFAAFVRPNPIFDNLATWATIFTLIGAVCFFIGAYLMWPDMAAEEQA